MASRLEQRLAKIAEQVAALDIERGDSGDLARFASYRGRELDWMRDTLLGPDGKPKRYWAAQRVIVERLIQKRFVTVRSCRKGGKTELGGDVILAFAQTGPSIVVSTAAGGRQVETGLWSRVNAQFRRSRIPLLGECLTTQLKVAPDWYAIGFSTNDAGRFQGFHAGVDVPDDPDAPEPATPAEIVDAIERAAHAVAKRSNTKRLLLLFDEAASVDQVIFDAAKGSMEGEYVYALLLANPTRDYEDSHEFCRSHRPGSIYHRIRITARESDDPVECDETFTVPYWLARAESMEQKYDEGDPNFAPYVLGQFRSGDVSNRVIPFAFLRAACEPHDGLLKRGAHVGFDTAWKGSDANVAALYVDSLKVSVDAWHSQDTLATWDRLKRLREHWQSSLELEIPWKNVHIDDAPVAAGIIDQARREGANLDCVSFAASATGAYRWLHGPARFKNRRAEMYWVLRELLRQRKACIPAKYEASWRELGAIEYGYTPGTDEYVLEPKEKLRDRLGKSPDHADADVLAFAASPRVAVSWV